MLRKICLFMASGSLLLLTACSTFSGKNGYFHDCTQNYLDAKSTAPLACPKGSEPQGIQNDYPIPESAGNATQTAPVNTLPPDLANK